MLHTEKLYRRLLAAAGGGIIVYCLAVLVFAATSPDVRLRFLLVDDADATAVSSSPDLRGIEIQKTVDARFKGPTPQAGERLLRLGERRTRHFVDFTDALLDLRDADVPLSGQLAPGSESFEELDQLWGLPRVVQEENGPRFVAAEILKRGATTPRTTWLEVQSLPLGDVLLSLIWFVLELAIFAVGALAFWNRPFDRQASLFFAMCIVTLGAFVGGYHWWVIAGSLWLNVPFAVCAMLLPVVTLHFFLIYPRPKSPIERFPKATIAVLYSAPAVAILCFLMAHLVIWWLARGEQSPERVVEIIGWLTRLRIGVYVYVSLAAVYFVATLVALLYSVATTRNPVERSQVKWILWAGLIATGFIGYTLVLAYASRAEFALGGGGPPMFCASLVFMLAYAVGIVRYKLMLVEQVLDRGMWYYVLSYGATAIFALMVGLSSLLPIYGTVFLSNQQSAIVAALVMLVVVLLIWARDQWQRLIDRRFFREKYRLDRALQRMNRAVGHLADPQSLAERMLSSCRDVLQSEQAALYLRERGDKRSYRLAAVDGFSEQVPMQFTAEDEFLEALKSDGSLQRITPGSRESLTPVQHSLRQLRAELVHALETDGEIAGLVVLGNKRSGHSYTAEDVTFLTAMGQITGVALHCARVHQDMSRLNEELRLKVERLAQQQRQIAILQAELTSQTAVVQPEPDREAFRREGILGSSPAIVQVLETVKKVAGTDASVLLRGESGTGKELLATAIHQNSPRRAGPMVRVHCAALSPGLLESELFGHVRGAFTGAHSDKVGRFEMANGGTLFLDEIGDISLETQVKLLRVLQERSFEPVGGTRTVHVDVRLIAATHQNLEQRISEGRFREDLYYRLNVISLTLPPLRDRVEDIFDLAAHFLKVAAERVGKRITHFEDEALDALLKYAWPGNIRELENVIERAAVLAEGQTITLADLPTDITQRRLPAPSPSFDPPRVLAKPKNARVRRGTMTVAAGSVSAFDSASERQMLAEALHKCGGNKAEAARLLGLPRSTYYSKLKKYAIAE